MAFAGGGSSVLAVAGADDRGGCVMLLDTLAPPASAAIARINCSHVCNYQGGIETAVRSSQAQGQAQTQAHECLFVSNLHRLCGHG